MNLSLNKMNKRYENMNLSLQLAIEENFKNGNVLKVLLYKHHILNLYELLERINKNETLGTEILDIISLCDSSVVFQIEHFKDGIFHISKYPGPHDKTIRLKYTPGHWTPVDRFTDVIIFGKNNCLLTSLAQNNYLLLDNIINRPLLLSCVTKLIEMHPDLEVTFDKKMDITTMDNPLITCSNCKRENCINNKKCVYCEHELYDDSLSNPSNKWECSLCNNSNDNSIALCAYCGLGEKIKYYRSM